MKKLKVIGIGNRLMGDDGIGVYIVEELVRQKFLKATEKIVGESDIGIEFVAKSADTDIDMVLEQKVISTEYAVRQTDIIVDYIVGETDIDYCLHHITGGDYIIIIDAAITGKEPGTVTYFTIDDMALCTSIAFSAHNHSFVEVAKTTMSNFTIIGIEPELVNYHWGLSEELSNSFQYILENVKKAICNNID